MKGIVFRLISAHFHSISRNKGMQTLYCQRNPLQMMTLACEYASNPLSPVLFLTSLPLPKAELRLLLSRYPSQTLQSVYIKEIKDLEGALRYITEELTSAQGLSGVIVLYTALDEAGWEVVAALQHAISLVKTTSICGCPEAFGPIRLSASRFFSEILGSPEGPQTT